MAEETNIVETKKVVLVEGTNRREITEDEFNKLNSDPKLRLKKLEEGVFHKLEKMNG